MTTFSELVVCVIADLRRAGFNNDADELQHLVEVVLDQNVSPSTRRGVLKQIESRCQ